MGGVTVAMATADLLKIKLNNSGFDIFHPIYLKFGTYDQYIKPLQNF